MLRLDNVVDIRANNRRYQKGDRPDLRAAFRRRGHNSRAGKSGEDSAPDIGFRFNITVPYFPRQRGAIAALQPCGSCHAQPPIPRWMLK
jgi:hypothetical protein